MLRDEPFTLLDIYHVILMVACHDPTCPEKICHMPNLWTALMDAIVLFALQRIMKLQKILASYLLPKFTYCANQSDAFIGSKNKFIYQKEKTLLVEKPVNYYLYLCDRDTLLLLKKIYGGNGVKKIDIENDNEVLVKFFQDVQQGIQLLTMLTKDQSQHLTS